MRLDRWFMVAGLALAASAGCLQQGEIAEDEAGGAESASRMPTREEQLVEQQVRAKLVEGVAPEATGVWEPAGTARFVTPDRSAILARQPTLSRGVPDEEGSRPMLALADGRQFRMKPSAVAALGAPTRLASAHASPGSGPVGPELTPRAQIGTDDRTRIADASYTKYPYRAVGTIMTNKTDTSGWCTASLIGPRLAITAGHCVYNKYTNSWNWNTWFSPGHRGEGSNRFPNGTPRRVVGLVSFHGWFADEDPDHDVGFLILADEPQTASLGWFGFGWWSGSLEDVWVGTYQYPGADYSCAASPNRDERCGGYQYFDGGEILDQCGNLLEYEIDTNPGSSGSPAYRWWNGERWIVGPHAYGFSPCDSGDNKAVRLGQYKAGVGCDLIKQFPSAYASRSCG